ncbi:MAG: RluA family pseudouridine synthase [Nannocystaceae bacterium]|nr:RluA family pseudouridine synthase [Nannocystaceae bacterium]
MSEADVERIVEQDGPTVSALVREALAVPWSRARELCRSGRVWLDDVRADDPAQRVRRGQRLRVRPTAKAQPRSEQPGALAPERIVYLDDAIVVVDKPAGISSVPFDEDEHDSLVQRLSLLLRQQARRSLPPLRVVHRIDADTTGLLVFARTREAERALAMQFRRHDLHRRYVGIALGSVRGGTRESLLVPDRGDGMRGSWHGRGKPPAQARNAVTFVRVDEVLALADEAFTAAPSPAVARAVSWVSCTLQTGRTHQIRIHLAESGHPLLGEPVYVRAGVQAAPHWGRPAGAGLRAPPGVTLRPMLHAAELGFVHPTEEREISLQAPLPDDFVQWRAHLVRLRRSL